MTTSIPSDDTLAALLARPEPLVDAPEALVRRAMALADAPPSLLRRLVASLRFDSALQTAAGVRGAVPARVRQLLFSAPGCDVDLRIERLGGERVRVSGQLLGPGAEVQAWLQVGGRQWQASCDDLSEFRFDDVPAGATVLRLQGCDWELALPDFDTQA